MRALRKEKKRPDSRPNKDVKRTTRGRGGYGRMVFACNSGTWGVEAGSSSSVHSHKFKATLGVHETVSRYKTLKIQAKQNEHTEFEMRNIIPFIIPNMKSTV